MEQELRGLLLAGLDGDASAYRVFLQRLSTLLRGYFRRRLQRLPDEVEDLVQDTLMAVHAQRHTYRPGDPDNSTAEWLVAPEDEAADSKRDIGRLLETLPDHQRLPIQHTKIEGLSVAETARLTGMSESAVKVGVHRGIKALARLWKETT